MDRLHGHRIKDQPFDVEIGGQPSEDTRQPRFRADNYCLGGNPRRIPKIRGNPELGFVFRSNNGLPISLDKVVRRMIRPALEAIDLPWHGWHAFRRGLASNLHAMGASDKVVQRILCHSRPHVTKERYIKVFDRTVLEAAEKLQKRIEEPRQAKEPCRQLELSFGDGVERPRTALAEHPAFSRLGDSSLPGQQLASTLS